MASHDFDADAFLQRPLTARIAANGPTVRPVWFRWEDGAFEPASLSVLDLSYPVAR